MDFETRTSSSRKRFIQYLWPVFFVLISEILYVFLQNSERGENSWTEYVIWPKAEFFMALFVIYYLHTSPFSQKYTRALSLLMLLFVGLNLTDFNLHPLGVFVQASVYILIITLYFLRTRAKKNKRKWDFLKLAMAFAYVLVSLCLITISHYFINHVPETADIGLIRKGLDYLLAIRRPLCAIFIGIHLYRLIKHTPDSEKPTLSSKIDEIGQRLE